MYLGLQASIAPTIGPTYEIETGEKKGYVKNANLQCTMRILLFQIILRVAEGVFDVYILNMNELKGRGPLGKLGDINLCRNHQMIIQGI
jgi:hypothetical protein